VREEIGDSGGVAWSYAGAHRLKGIKDKVELFRARRADASEVT